ncbi:MAG: DNA repair protein RecO [Akkermansiaceae bacterium]|nr:DNA repair protein RecO [Akkermansiaceae bacterium]
MEQSQGIITRLTKLTDTSLIVHWFTADFGLIKTVAKGARRPKSPFAGRLDLFFSADIQWTRSRSSELHALRESAPTDFRAAIRSDYHSTLLAAYFCRLLEACVEPDHPEPELHDLLRRALDHIHAAGPSSKALFHFEHEVARLLGLTHHRSQAAGVLKQSLGALPPQREALLNALANPSNFPFPDSPSGPT